MEGIFIQIYLTTKQSNDESKKNSNWCFLRASGINVSTKLARRYSVYIVIPSFNASLAFTPYFLVILSSA